MNYFLMPGKKIGARGLPGGEIVAGEKPRKISETELKCFEPSLEYLVAVGTIEKKETDEPAQQTEPEKSAKRLELEAQAVELGIEFTDRTTQKELASMIEKELA
jgi:hypothetical protein